MSPQCKFQILNFKILNKFNLDQAVSEIWLICSDHVHVFENVNQICLCEVFSEMTVVHKKWK